ncbi:MAG: 2-dehydro-3-deoxyglucarate aldolase [Chitinophagaceae bacterium]|nr:2-dehydro-3-deoxyglucarate aldolase [Chitinophagaceae bacterium]
MKNLKARLKQGETVNGCWLNLGTSITAEIAGLSGFDWVLIDLEHGAGVEKDVLDQLQALEHTPAAAIVRVEGAQRQRIHRVLDMGAEGIMCPRINNAGEATEVANGLHYPPKGKRGVAKMVRATGFGQNFTDYYNNAKDNILGIVQIETVEVLNHLDEIAAIDGIDVLFIGPADLTMELGIFGQFDHPLFRDALKATVNAAAKAGKATGILFFNPDDYKTYHHLGIRMIACGSDATFIADGARNMAGKLSAARANL